MYETAYDIVAMGMRYLFLALIIYILVRLIQHSVTEFKAVQAVKEQVRSVSPGYLEAILPEEIAGEKYALRRENTIGRSKRCSIQVDLAGVSPVHALLYEKKDGLYLSDFGSRTGSFLNEEKIGKKEELLYTQDVLQFGEFCCKLHLAGEEEEDA